MNPSAATSQPPETILCSRCHKEINEAMDQVPSGEGITCRDCSNSRRWDQEARLPEQSQEINYPAGLLGALIGGSLGVLVWWGITVWSNIAFGAIAILIGIAVGKGATLLSGNKRSRGLQYLSVTVAAASFFYATYLVNRTFIQQALAKGGKELALSLWPNPAMLFQVISINFGAFDFLFLGIVLWEAWKLTAPVKAP